MNFAKTLRENSTTLQTLIREVNTPIQETTLSSTIPSAAETTSVTDPSTTSLSFFYNAAFEKNNPTLNTTNEALTVVLASVIPLFVIGLLGFAIYYYVHVYRKNRKLSEKIKRDIENSNSPQFGSTFKFIVRDQPRIPILGGKTDHKKENPFDNSNAIQ